MLKKIDIIPGWKGAILGFLTALVALLAQAGVPLPEWVTDSWLASLAAVLAIAASLALKWMRGR